MSGNLSEFDERLVTLFPANSPVPEERILRTLFRVRTEDDWFIQSTDVLVPLKKTMDGDVEE